MAWTKMAKKGPKKERKNRSKMRCHVQLACYLSYLSIKSSLFDNGLFPLTFHVDSASTVVNVILNITPKLHQQKVLTPAKTPM